MHTRNFDGEMNLVSQGKDVLEGADGEDGWSLALYPGSYYGLYEADYPFGISEHVQDSWNPTDEFNDPGYPVSATGASYNLVATYGPPGALPVLYAALFEPYYWSMPIIIAENPSNDPPDTPSISSGKFPKSPPASSGNRTKIHATIGTASSRRQTYICPICNRSVSRRSRLEDHANRHAGKKPHECAGKCGLSGCTVTFSCKATLKRHCLPKGRRRVNCKDCNASVLRQNLNRHQRRCPTSAKSGSKV